jgi:hypothetical protein
MHPSEHVTVGTFVITTDNFLLLPPSPADFMDVSPEPRLALELDQRFDGQFVSILGHMGERHRSPSDRVPSLIASKIVLQKDIERRAFEIFCAGNGGSALSHWLRAEAELLGLSPAATP